MLLMISNNDWDENFLGVVIGGLGLPCTLVSFKRLCLETVSGRVMQMAIGDVATMKEYYRCARYGHWSSYSSCV